jgi:hypothetical protein
MKTILISGCSYSLVFSHHEIQDHIKKTFGVDQVVNLSETGSSIKSQIQRVIEWVSVSKNKPHLVLMPFTHIERYDAPLSNVLDPATGFDVSLCVSMDPFESVEGIKNRFKSRVPMDLVNQLLKTMTLTYNDVSAFNNFVTQAETFSGWLENRNIKHLFFNMSNNLNENKFQNIGKKYFLNENQNIVNIFSFCGNKFMHDHAKSKINGGQYTHHHDVEQNKLLINKLKTFII